VSRTADPGFGLEVLWLPLKGMWASGDELLAYREGDGLATLSTQACELETCWRRPLQVIKIN